MSLKLHNFFRSSTSTRVRAALNIKGLDYDYVPYVLRDGQTRTPEYLAKNPQGLVLILEKEDGTFLTQSLAIMEWLEETRPEPALLPAAANGRARVRALSYMVACEIHPLNNLRVLFRIRDQFGANEEAQKEWFTHWVAITFDALEGELSESNDTGTYCHGDTPTMADCCLYAQVWNNKRFALPLENWPTISRIYAALDTLPEFQKAAPPNQPDAA
jgi:maleylpyruvate isomerase